MRRLLIASTAAVLLGSMLGTPASASTPPGGAPPVTQTTVTISLRLDSTLSTGDYSGNATTTADVVAAPVTTAGGSPTWQGQGAITVSPESYSYPDCTFTKGPTTGTLTVVVIKAGDVLDVTWSADVAVPPPTIECNGEVSQGIAEGLIQPFLLVEPRTFTLPPTGGTQALSGGIPGIQNTGTMTVTKRETCGQKVKEVNTYPPGQTTSASSMVGKAFAVGEKVTADTNVEFVYEDGSIMRLAKGASYQETPKCDASIDKSKSYKGTLLLGKIWASVTSVFGERDYAMERCFRWGDYETGVPTGCERTVTGNRGTTFWIVPTRRSVSYSVSEGSIWVQGVTATNRPVSKKIIVRAGHTLVLSSRAKPVLRKLKASDAFPFG